VSDSVFKSSFFFQDAARTHLCVSCLSSLGGLEDFCQTAEVEKDCFYGGMRYELLYIFT
jgi:hypothetical protein